MNYLENKLKKTYIYATWASIFVLLDSRDIKLHFHKYNQSKHNVGREERVTEACTHCSLQVWCGWWKFLYLSLCRPIIKSRLQTRFWESFALGISLHTNNGIKICSLHLFRVQKMEQNYVQQEALRYVERHGTKKKILNIFLV